MNDLLEQANRLRPLLRSEASLVEEKRRLTGPVLDALHEMQAFHLQVTAAYGGPGCDTVSFLEIIESLSRADPSSGWCAMVGSESSGCINAYANPEAAAAMLEVGKPGVALTVVGEGQASVEADGFRVSGRWRFASSCRHAGWLGALATTAVAGEQKKLMFFVPATDAHLLDTWTTSGLVGTASDDFELDNVFVPEAFAVDLFAQPLDAATTWRFPVSLRFAMSKAAALCGAARGAFDLLTPMLERTPFAGAQPAKEEARFHVMLAEAEASIEGGRAYLYRTVNDAWSTLETDGSLDIAAVARVRLAVVFAARKALEALNLMQEIGGTATSLDAAFDRFVRDMNVARHHLQLQTHVLEDVGRVLVGKLPRNPLF